MMKTKINDFEEYFVFILRNIKVFLKMLLLISVVSTSNVQTLHSSSNVISAEVLTSLQEIGVSGTVTDAKTKEPLPGVTIRVAGATIGTVTGVDGTYSLRLSTGNETLIFSFVGYQT